MQEKKFVLTYWNLRGTTQAIRDLLEYLGLEYEDKTIQFSSEVSLDFSKYVQNPSLPHLKHGNFEVIQIVPICKYICRVSNRLDLLGKKLIDEIIIQTMIMDILRARKEFLGAVKACQGFPDETFSSQLSQKLRNIRNVLIPSLVKTLSSSEWILSYLSLADFMLYEQLFYFQGYCPQIIKDPVFLSYMKRFQSLQPINRYFLSGKCNHSISMIESLSKKWKGARKVQKIGKQQIQGSEHQDSFL